MSNLSYGLGEAYPQGDRSPRGLSIDEHVPLTGAPIAFGPFPFRVRGVQLINRTARTLTVTDDRGKTYNADPFTSSSFPASDTLRLTAAISAAVTEGTCTVVVTDMPQPLNTSQLSTLAPATANVITGIVNGNGTIAAGTGFTVNRTGIGQYTVTFSTPFTSPPIVLANLLTSIVQAVEMISIYSVTANGFSVQTSNAVAGGGSNFTDFPWNFSAQLAV